jgi:hypothetical protein
VKRKNGMMPLLWTSIGFGVAGLLGWAFIHFAVMVMCSVFCLSFMLAFAIFSIY